MDVHMLYFKLVTNKDYCIAGELYTESYVAAWVEEVWREWIYVYIWPSPFAVHQKLVVTFVIWLYFNIK